MDNSVSSNPIEIDKFEPKMVESFTTEANLKIMVPNGISGAIIGKNGATIAKIQQETGCEISVSKTNEFFPSSKERVVLVSGSVQGILNVISYMTDQIEERRDQRDRFDTKNVSRDNEIKIIVPDKLARLIIGKQGEFVKLVQESAGVKMVMMSKEDALNMNINERVLTLSSEIKLQLFSGAEMVILKMAQDPIMNSTLYTHMDYSAAQGQPSRIFSSRDRSRSPINQYSSYRDNSTVPRHYPQPASVPYGSSIRPVPGTNQYNTSESMSPMQLMQTFSIIRNTCQSRDYNQMAENEIMNALEVMVKYNMLTVLSGIKHDVSSMARTPNPNGSFNGGYNSTKPYEDSLDFTANNFGATYANAEAVVTAVAQEGRSCSMYIPDTVIGAIVGKQGSNVSEIQRYTETTIDIEKRKPGEKFEGKDRLVAIKGEPQGVQMARQEIMRVVNEELRRLEKFKK